MYLPNQLIGMYWVPPKLPQIYTVHFCGTQYACWEEISKRKKKTNLLHIEEEEDTRTLKTIQIISFSLSLSLFLFFSYFLFSSSFLRRLYHQNFWSGVPSFCGSKNDWRIRIHWKSVQNKQWKSRIWCLPERGFKKFLDLLLCKWRSKAGIYYSI